MDLKEQKEKLVKLVQKEPREMLGEMERKENQVYPV